VCNQLGGRGANLIASEPENALLRLIPWAGVAACVSVTSGTVTGGTSSDNSIVNTATIRDGLAYCFLPLPVPAARNYLAIYGGNVRLGSATLADARVQVVDADAADPLAFALDHFGEALEAGVVDLLVDGGAIAYIPDLRLYDQPLGRFSPATGIPAQAPAGTLR